MTLPLEAIGACPRSSGDVMTIVSTQANFSPIIVTRPGADIQWKWADGTITSGEVHPSKAYGSAAVRRNTLRVTPWSAVTQLNFGYDRGDGGSADIELNSNQYVSSIENLNLVASSLERFAASYCPLTNLNFRGFSKLIQLECYLTSNLAQVNLEGCISLRRVCFEDNSLSALDLSYATEMRDLRGAINGMTNVTFPATGMPNLWHMCLRDNSGLNALPNLAGFPLLEELWIWNSNQYGTLTPYGGAMASIQCFGQHLSGLDFSHTSSVYYVDASNNQISAVNWGNCTGFHVIDLSNNLLTQSEVDVALARCVVLGTSGHTIRLTGNAVPSSMGLTDIATLQSRSWTVAVDT